jgi:V8-like Glu-specific endopeptidase
MSVMGPEIGLGEFGYEGSFEAPFGELSEESELGEGSEFGEFGEFGEFAEGAGQAFPHPTLGYVWSRPAAEVGAVHGEVAGPSYAHPRLGYIRSRPGEQEVGDVEPEIIGADQRVAVLDTTRVPYRWICHLDLDFGPNPKAPGQRLTGRGTGTLISPRHVLTVGHVLHDRFDDISPGLVRDVQRVVVTPGNNCSGSRAKPFGSVRGVRFRVHPRWRASMDMQFDIGLITLGAPIGATKFASIGNAPLGYWGSKSHGAGTRISPYTASSLANATINLSGYPGDKCCLRPFDPAQACSLSSWAGAQFRATGKVINPSPPGAPRLITYNADTFGGHSGAPVWLLWKTYRNIVALHTGPGRFVSGETPGVSNRGVRITREVIALVRSWM